MIENNGVTFTAEQEALITAKDGTVLSLSAVGSGKTTVLIERIRRAIEAGQDPSKILALTFTNRAANNLKDQLAKVLELETAEKVYASTFHALCADVLRSAQDRTGLLHEFRIYDDDDVVEIGLPCT